MLDIRKNKTLRGAKSHIRREISGKHDITLSRMRLVKDTLTVTFCLPSVLGEENKYVYFGAGYLRMRFGVVVVLV